MKTNIPTDVIIGATNKEYTPKLQNAITIEIGPLINKSSKVLLAISLNNWFFAIKAFGTILAAEKNKLMDKILQILIKASSP